MDRLEKPQELVLYRHVNMGGLGLQNIKYKAISLLIKSFLETSICPDFLRNLFHGALFRRYVLLDTSGPLVLAPPYYTSSFFDIIRQIKQKSNFKLSTITAKQIYCWLLENNVTMCNYNGISLSNDNPNDDDVIQYNSKTSNVPIAGPINRS